MALLCCHLLPLEGKRSGSSSWAGHVPSFTRCQPHSLHLLTPSPDDQVRLLPASQRPGKRQPCIALKFRCATGSAAQPRSYAPLSPAAEEGQGSGLSRRSQRGRRQISSCTFPPSQLSFDLPLITTHGEDIVSLLVLNQG